MDRLQEILEEGIIDEIHSQLKTGKEAEVWLVSHRGEPVAAKLYKSREFRSFKNDAGYREGRSVRNSRTQRAMDKGTKFGREASEEAWKSAEADALAKLHAAGVRVPRPVLFYEGVLLMEVIGDEEGRVAPRLVDAHIPMEAAQGLYQSIRGEVVKMLSADLIHGDLSEFNILLSHDGPVIIDFPQVVMAAKNSLSEQYFKKDLGNMVRFFSGIDPAIATRHGSDVDEIWRAYVRRELSPSFVPSGRSSWSRPRHSEGSGGGSGPRRGDSMGGDSRGGDSRRGDSRGGDSRRGDSRGGDSRRGDSRSGGFRGGDARPDARGEGFRRGDSRAGAPPPRSEAPPPRSEAPPPRSEAPPPRSEAQPPRNGAQPMPGSADARGRDARRWQDGPRGRSGPTPGRRGPEVTVLSRAKPMAGGGGGQSGGQGGQSTARGEQRGGGQGQAAPPRRDGDRRPSHGPPPHGGGGSSGSGGGRSNGHSGGRGGGHSGGSSRHG